MKEVTAGVDMPMSAVELQKAKDKFLREVCCSPEDPLFFSYALRKSYNGAVLRGCVYVKQRPGESTYCYEQRKEPFRKCAKQLVSDFAKQYRDEIVGETHAKNIEQLANEISAICPSILRDERFRIGTTQKFVNLYLKYLWAGNKGFSLPPHCPFDAKIIGLLPSPYYVAWTKMDDIKQYMGLVKAAKEKADDLSLSEWELIEWNKLNP